jgi:hypothetical protein
MSSDSTPAPYRQVQPTGDSEKQLQSDKKILQIKCSKSKKLFQTYLIRDPGAKQFRVVAFEPFPERAVMTYSPANSLFVRLVKVIGDWLNRARATAKPAAEPLDSGQEDGAVLYLGIQDIDWSGHDCPDCHSQKPNRSGSSIMWLQCGHCSNIFCVGNLEPERFIFVCPWCGNRGQLSTQQTNLNAPAKPTLLAKVQSPPKTTGPRALPPGQRPKRLPPPKAE